jgi:hypothetical protein
MPETLDEPGAGLSVRDVPVPVPGTASAAESGSGAPPAAPDAPHWSDDDLALRRGAAIEDVAVVVTGQPPGDSTPGNGRTDTPDPELVDHVAKALADLRLLAQFVASTPDRRFIDARPAMQQAARRGSEAAAGELRTLYEKTLLIGGMTAEQIARNAAHSADLFFLLDRLSTIAYPASPDSIRLTASYLKFPLGGGKGGDDALQAAATKEAKELRRAVTTNRIFMAGIFCLAIGLSIYALFGQVLLGERDRIVTAIDRESEAFYSQSRLTLPAQIFRNADLNHVFLVNPQEMQNWIMGICPKIDMVLPSPIPAILTSPSLPATQQSVRIYPSPELMRSCDAYEYLEAQRRQADRAVADWVGIALAMPEWFAGTIRRLFGHADDAQRMAAAISVHAAAAKDAAAFARDAANNARDAADRVQAAADQARDAARLVRVGRALAGIAPDASPEAFDQAFQQAMLAPSADPVAQLAVAAARDAAAVVPDATRAARDAAVAARDAALAERDAAAAGGDPRPQRDYSYRPWGETIVTAMGSYILPILFGVIGAWAASERELRRRLERFEVTRTDRHTYRRGLLLGGVVGGVVGLFFSTDTLKNLSLTYSAIALVAGFAGDRVFRFLDDLINRIFSIERPPPGTAARAGG